MLCKTGSSILAQGVMENIAQSAMPQHSNKSKADTVYTIGYNAWHTFTRHDIIKLSSPLQPFLLVRQFWNFTWLLLVQWTTYSEHIAVYENETSISFEIFQILTSRILNQIHLTTWNAVQIFLLILSVLIYYHVRCSIKLPGMISSSVWL